MEANISSLGMHLLTMDEHTWGIALIGGVIGSVMQYIAFNQIGVAGERLDEAAEDLKAIQ